MTARAGESVVLRCDVIHPVTGQPPPYVVEWFKFGVPIPIFIKFGYYPPHVDPEYAGKSGLQGAPPCASFPSLVLVWLPLPARGLRALTGCWSWSGFLLPLSLLPLIFSDWSVISVFHSLCLFPSILWTP